MVSEDVLEVLTRSQFGRRGGSGELVVDAGKCSESLSVSQKFSEVSMGGFLFSHLHLELG